MVKGDDVRSASDLYFIFRDLNDSEDSYLFRIFPGRKIYEESFKICQATFFYVR